LTLSRFDQPAAAAGANAGGALDSSSNEDRGDAAEHLGTGRTNTVIRTARSAIMAEPYLLAFPECVRILLFCDTLPQPPGIPA
jgi:hypothetical protein